MRNLIFICAMLLTLSGRIQFIKAQDMNVNVKRPALTEAAEAYREKMFPNGESSLLETDPEFVERFYNFAFDEVVNHDGLDGRTRFIAILATLIGCQGIDEYKEMLPAALNFGVTPVEAKEIVYQAVDYCGMGRVFPFLKATNEIFKERGIALPLASQANTTKENRLEKGNQAQIDIFGNGMKESWKTAPEETRHITEWLASNCFGDYYTRSGLDLKQREMITFCFLAAQGGCEPQLTAHARGNMNLGNDKSFLIKVVSQCLPYIGYPRTLNALKCVNDAAKLPQTEKSIVRLSKIEVYPEFLDEYIAFATEVGETSIRTESGVLAMYGMAEKENPCKITILEIYADTASYKSHIASAHFQKYKTGTLKMVKSLELIDQNPMNPKMKLKND